MSVRVGGGGQAWGTRSQIAGTVNELRDVLGNRDGLWGNEAAPAGETGNAFDKNPLAQKIGRFFEAGLSTGDEVAALEAFTTTFREEHGPITTLSADQLPNASLFAAQKAIALARYDRSPADVTDGFVRAAGTVGGEPIEAREIFFQRWRPVGQPTGKVFVLSPGFQETGRNFYEQIDKLNRQGHDVVVMDHQWAGLSDGSPGGLDRGYGVARDVATVMSVGQEIVEGDYADVAGAEVVPIGNSMGAGPGVFAALVLIQDGAIELEGRTPPVVKHAALQSPFVNATDNLLNDVVALASELPLVNKIALPSMGVPVLNTDDVGAQKGAQQAVLDDARVQLHTMTSARDDMAQVMARFEERGLDVDLYIVHGDDDPLADSAASRAIGERMGKRAHVDIIDSNNHVLEQNPGEQDHLIAGIQRLLAGD